MFNIGRRVIIVTQDPQMSFLFIGRRVPDAAFFSFFFFGRDRPSRRRYPDDEHSAGPTLSPETLDLHVKVAVDADLQCNSLSSHTVVARKGTHPIKLQVAAESDVKRDNAFSVMLITHLCSCALHVFSKYQNH
jgi:hypothetical protein